MQPQQVISEVHAITASLVRLGLSEDQNFPSTPGKAGGAIEITVNNASQLTIALRNLPYRQIYDELVKARAFNMKLIDGALIVLRYAFRNGQLTDHSLSYFPAPDLEHFQNDADIYLTDEIFADIVARNIVTIPLRFDYSNDANKFIEIHHPYCHLTLGQYKNCRIPVSAPLSPVTFVAFILRSFYNTAARKFSDEINVPTFFFARTITDKEFKLPHFACDASRPELKSAREETPNKADAAT